MAATKLDIFNLALSAVGARALLSDVNDASREGEVCRLFYDEVVNQILHAAPWPATTGVERLTLTKERDTDAIWVATDPEPGWRFMYVAPTDMIRPRYLTTYDRFVLSLSNVDVKSIMTNVEEAILVYTKTQAVVSLWGPMLTLAVVYGLASHMVMPLQGKPERARMMLEMANAKMLEARINAANQQENQHESMPEWIRARGYSIASPESRFVYPFGPLLSGIGLT